jgi:hypothetical protein
VAQQHFSRKIKKAQASRPGAAVHARAQAGTTAWKAVVSPHPLLFSLTRINDPVHPTPKHVQPKAPSSSNVLVKSKNPLKSICELISHSRPKTYLRPRPTQVNHVKSKHVTSQTYAINRFL